MSEERARAGVPAAPARERRVFAGALLLAAVALIGLAWIPATTLAPGYDEVAHVGAARYLDEYGTNALNPEHPPLVKRLVGRALAAAGATEPAVTPAPARDQWAYGRATLAPDDRYDAGRMLAARLPLLALALLGLVFVGCFAARLAGAWAAAVAMGLYAASPTVLSGASMVLTDLPVGVLALACIHLSHRGAQELGRWTAFAAGAAAAAAALAKFSGVIVPVLALGMMAAQMWLCDRRPARAWLPVLAMFLAGLLLGAFALAGSTTFEEYAAGFRLIGANHLKGYGFYAFGRFDPDGFWWYFPAVLAVKSTLSELVGLLALALLLPAMASGRTPVERRGRLVAWAWLALPPLVYLAALMQGASDIGQRYLAPLYPFACVAAGVLAVQVRRSWRVPLGAALVAVQVASALAAEPDPLSFFNGIAGCRGIRGMRCLDDSNIDWGQSLNRVWPAVSGRLGPTEELQVDVVSSMPLQAFLPRFRAIGPEGWIDPKPGLYVISAHVLIRRLGNNPELPRSLLFQRLDPEDRIGNSYFVVDLRGPLARPAEATPNAPR